MFCYLSHDEAQEGIFCLDIGLAGRRHHAVQAVAHDDIAHNILPGGLLCGGVGTGALAQCWVAEEGLHLGHAALADLAVGELAGHIGWQGVDLRGDEVDVGLPGGGRVHPAHVGGNAELQLVIGLKRRKITVDSKGQTWIE